MKMHLKNIRISIILLCISVTHMCMCFQSQSLIITIDNTTDSDKKIAFEHYIAQGAKGLVPPKYDKTIIQTIPRKSTITYNEKFEYFSLLKIKFLDQYIKTKRGGDFWSKTDDPITIIIKENPTVNTNFIS